MTNTIDIALDTCSLVNLMNGNQLDAVLSISNKSFVISPSVYKETTKIPTQKEVIDEYLASGQLRISESELDVSLLSNLYENYNLGDGETESIAICKNNPSTLLCCDDKKARTAAGKEMDSTNIIGSLRLLKIAVGEEIIKCTDAQISYLEMKFKGGFLPKGIDNHYFCKAS